MIQIQRLIQMILTNISISKLNNEYNIRINYKSIVCLQIITFKLLVSAYQLGSMHLTTPSNPFTKSSQFEASPQYIPLPGNKYNQHLQSQYKSGYNWGRSIILILVALLLAYVIQIGYKQPLNRDIMRDEQRQVINALRAKAMKRMTIPQVKRQNKRMIQWIKRALSYIQQQGNAVKYIDIDKYRQNNMFKELPFCIIISEYQNNLDKILESVNTQQYNNYQIKIIQSSSDTNSQRQSPKIQYITNSQKIKSYRSYDKIIMEKCKQYSAIMIINKELERNNLLRIYNEIYQSRNTWIIYNQNKKADLQEIEIVGFFQRVWELVKVNDFQKDNFRFLENLQEKRQVEQKELNYALIVLAMLQLCSQHSFHIQSYNPSDNSIYSSISLLSYHMIPIYSSFSIIQRTPYQPLDALNQDFPVIIQQLNRYFYIFILDNYYDTTLQWLKRRSKFANVTYILKAKQYQHLMYLPQEHSLGLRQIHEVGTFSVQKLSNNTEQLAKLEQQKTRFCVTVLSHNNIQNQRYIKVMQSIIQQNYSNYHIVFIDDQSSDDNMEKTIQYLENRNFRRVTYVQNVQRKYGTYNIINAAFVFCQREQVQLLVDGDDQLIGRQVFKAMNRAYQSNTQLAMIYTSYKTSNYKYGDGQAYKGVGDIHYTWLNRRKYIHELSPIRSWKVQLVRQIPMQAHIVDGKWLDTGYDDGLQYPLFQIAGVERIGYLQEILYVANKEYGDNDDSSKEKRLHRLDLIGKLLKRKPYEKAKEFREESQRQLMEILLNQNGVVYKVINIRH